MKRKEKLIIIDGNALIHRSFHALPPTLKTKTGELVNAVYGFTAFLLRAVKELKPDYLILTLDKKGKTFRHEQYSEYKATRTKAPDELYAQFDRVREMATILNIPIYEESGFEADDLIGTISKTVDHAIDKVIVTGDMDTLQLVDESTVVYAMSRGINEAVVYDEQAVRARYGLEPGQVVDYKALRGDPSDNIPGVRGIGEKTAIELLQDFETLENLYESLDKVAKERIRALLLENKANAFMSKDLATIKIDVPIDIDLERARFGGYDREAVAKLFTELEFKSLLVRLYELSAGTQPDNSVAVDKFERDRQNFKYQLIDSDKLFSKLLSSLKKVKLVAFDTETTGLDPFSDRLLGLSLSWKEGEAVYLSLRSKQELAQVGSLFAKIEKEENKEAHPWLIQLAPFFADQNIKKFCHNIKFDISMLEASGLEVKGVCFDTMLASYLLNPGSRQHGLDNVAFSELHFEKITKEDLLGQKKDKIDFSEAPLDRLAIYACEDADITFRLKKKLESHLREQKLERLLLDIELPLSQVLLRVENKGIALDVQYLDRLSKKLHFRIDELEKEIQSEAGKKFNINSPSQLQVVLFEDLEISTAGIAKTKTGLSTAADELVKIRNEHNIVRLIEEYRELTKLTNTYVDALPNLVNSKTGRIHSNFNQTIAATGRLSSTEPNLQNIPVKGDWGKEVRKAFVASEGKVLLALDYSQIELRLAAHYSADKTLINSFKNNIDIHASTAAAINNVRLDAVTKEMRREAKAVNFGVLYGQGPHGLSQTADIPYAQAKQFIDQYFEVFPGIKNYIEKTIKDAGHYGFVETLFGRKRFLPEINSSMMQVRKSAERMAVNTPLQGTAADMIKVAMIRVQSMIDDKYSSDEVAMILQVHDELVFEVDEKLVDELAERVKVIMEQVIKLKVPIVAEIKVGKNWGEME